MLKTLDLACLRTLLLGVELGSFARAADRQNLAQSTVSAQLRKLEALLGREITVRDGRRLILSPTGERLYAYARRLLELNDEAMTALERAPLRGPIRLGLQEDFGSSFMSNILAQFVRTHPEVSVEIEVCRNATLLDRVRSGRQDLALAWNTGDSTPHSSPVVSLPLHWIASEDWTWPPYGEALPLASLEAPCALRAIAIDVLEQAEIRWRQSVSSQGLGEIWEAVRAGLGITVRPCIGMPRGLKVLHGLPELPPLELRLHRASARPTKAVQTLSKMLMGKIKDKVQFPDTY